MVVGTAVGTIYLVLGCLQFRPIGPFDTSHLPGTIFGGPATGDPPPLVWYLEWTTYAARHLLNPFFSTLINAPYGANLTPNTSMPLLGLLGAPFTLTLGPIATYNVLIRLALAASAAAMYLLLREWVGPVPSFVGGLIYGFGPWTVSQALVHLDLAWAAIPPLIIWASVRCARGSFSPRRSGVLIGALVAAQMYVTAEIDLLILLSVGAAALILANRSRHLITDLRKRILNASPWFLGTFLLLTGYWIWSLLFGPGHISGPPQPSAVLQIYHSDLLSPFVPTFNQWLHPWWVGGRAMQYVGGNVTENAGYVGIPLAALFVLVMIARRHDRVVTTSGMVALAAFVLSLGPRLTVNGRTTAIPLPEAVLARIPFIRDIVPARFAMMVLLFVTLSVVVGSVRVWEMLEMAPVRSFAISVSAIGMVVAVAAALLFVVPARSGESAGTWPEDTLSTLSRLPAGATVLTYPYPTFLIDAAMTWDAQLGLRFRLLGGYVTQSSGRGAPTFIPPLLAPSSVIEYFTEDISNYYPPPPSVSKTQRDLCVFLRRYHVGGVIVWAIGSRGILVRRLVTSALGPPTTTTRDGSIAVWRVGSRCQP